MSEKAKHNHKKKVPLKIRMLCWLALGAYLLLCATYRVRYANPEALEKARALHPKGSFVFGLWHEFFFTAVATHRHQDIAPMISQSNDGELISFIAEALGFKPVRGSTSRGGASARDALYARIDSGLKAAFTADGPRGPRRKLKSGIVDLARTGSMAIVPLAISADRAWILRRSWDHSMIPKPFARLVVCYGDPVVVEPNAHGLAFATEKQKVRIALNQIADFAESQTGLTHATYS
jgi:lysophospholipid acyltransferase (LPLAT)-like uncharacterized protein